VNNYGASLFQLKELNLQYPGTPLYSYRVTLEVPFASRKRIIFVTPHNLSGRVSGPEANESEYNGVFFNETDLSQFGVTIYVAEIKKDGTVGSFDRLKLNYSKGITQEEIDVIEGSL